MFRGDRGVYGLGFQGWVYNGSPEVVGYYKGSLLRFCERFLLLACETTNPKSPKVQIEMCGPKASQSIFRAELKHLTP